MTHAATLTPPPRDLRRAAAEFWQNFLFWQARSAPIFGRVLKPLAQHLTLRYSSYVRGVTAANARRIFGPDVSARQVRTYGLGIAGSFIDFISDVGRYASLTDAELQNQIESISGNEFYDAARAAGRGAIIATAHMGSFEAGAAALRPREPKMHVVFKRDAMSRFEQVRSELRHRLGVIEAPIDDGWGVWFRLRDALQRNEIVMLQADRVMPGQKGVRVPFLYGHLEIPTGPVKLALATGAPVIPVFSRRLADGRVRLYVEPAIFVEPSEQSPHPALLQIAGLLEKHIRACPHQWLVIHRAFCEDASASCGASKEGAA